MVEADNGSTEIFQTETWREKKKNTDGVGGGEYSLQELWNNIK